ncbi:hypothetical protein AB9N91_004355 [Salmonella enterica]
MAVNNNIYEAVLNVIGVSEKLTANNATQLTAAQLATLQNLKTAMASWKGIAFAMREVTAADKPTTNNAA